MVGIMANWQNWLVVISCGLSTLILLPSEKGLLKKFLDWLYK